VLTSNPRSSGAHRPIIFPGQDPIEIILIRSPVRECVRSLDTSSEAIGITDKPVQPEDKLDINSLHKEAKTDLEAEREWQIYLFVKIKLEQWLISWVHL